MVLRGQGSSGLVKGYRVSAVAPGVTDVKSNSDIEWNAGTVLDSTIVLAPSADIKEIGKCLIVQRPEGSALRAAVNLETNPSVYQKALKLTGNLEMFMGQSGIMSSGSTSDFVLEGAPSGDGDGTKESPYSVAQVISGVSGTGWTQGYIVGWVDGMTLADGARFTVPATASSNVLIAASAEETNYMNCIPVQLPSGSVRSAINLQDNPANLGKIVKLEGSFEAYFGTKGLKSVTDFVIEGSPEPPVGQTVPVTSLL